MRAAVWDTYVQRPSGRVMHFDIVVNERITDKQAVIKYGQEYLKSKSLNDLDIRVEYCSFCHIAQATPEMEKQIKSSGFYIIEMENCS
ncbi:DUF2024 family protein [Gilvibacter sediminis]|uniref:DUF2024 family protein n=1 Tax=Gilvibacter sediminis TaxID=379071 RepID=UPI00234FFE6F|nr:DUF2024 family protein [Gilvibacter sediminis]MDC7997865.1 DUF2024 family protein [Gilvibacter sediminis]